MNKAAPEKQEPATYVEYLRKLWGIKSGDARHDIANAGSAPTDIYAAAEHKKPKPRPRTDWPY
jgi:hypothetical protein